MSTSKSEAVPHTMSSVRRRSTVHADRNAGEARRRASNEETTKFLRDKERRLV